MIMIGIRRRTAGLLAVAAVLALAACGAGPVGIAGSSAINGGVVAISAAGTYTYTVTITPVPASPDGCGDAPSQPNCVTQGLCGSGFTGDVGFRLASAAGVVDYLQSTGQVALTSGSWQGDAGYTTGGQFTPAACPWTITLTAQ